jgi:4-hydroxybenzoate polyprenyltransferase
MTQLSSTHPTHLNDLAEHPLAHASRWRVYLNLIRWDRPAGWLLLLWPTLAALWLAAGGWPGWHLLLVFVLGTILMRSAGCCINDVADRHFDRHVKRTALRPITSGLVSVPEALGVGAVLALVALALVLTTNVATMAWAVPALLVTVAYPYAKRVVSMPQAVLGVAFSFGIPMAFTAVQAGPMWELAMAESNDSILSLSHIISSWKNIPLSAWLLLLGNWCWVLAYDTEYAMVDRDDDVQIGMKTSAITLGRWDVAVVMACYIGFILLWDVAVADQSWWLVFVGFNALALAQVVWHYGLIHHRQRDDCFRAFRANHWLGFTLFAAIALGCVMAH